MSCYSCGSAFGLFKKELGCKNCGYAFCKDCLTKKAPVPKLKNEKHKVCLKCYKMLTGQTEPETYSPPEALKKRLAKLEERPHHSERTVPKSLPATTKLINTKGMSKEDIAIAVRLQKLKEKDPAQPSEKAIRERLDKLQKDQNAAPPATEHEIAEKLATLKGQELSLVGKPHVFKTEHRPDTQQVEDLLQEICEEVEIDSHHVNYTEDIENRLYRLQSGNDTPADLQNNMNIPDRKHQTIYAKNIPQIDTDHNISSGENVDWTEINHLIRQVANELEIDAIKAITGLKQDEELWRRLGKLSQKKEIKIKNSDDTVDDDTQDSSKDEEEQEEEACKNIIRELLEESRLEDALEEAELTGEMMKKAPSVPSKTNNQVFSKSDPDELPYCCLCTNDAILRCTDCYGDLYCKSCFREAHKGQNHSTSQYQPPAK